MKRKCESCRFYPSDCGYWQLQGKRDKGGNAITLVKPDTYHNCPDYQKASTDEVRR